MIQIVGYDKDLPLVLKWMSEADNLQVPAAIRAIPAQQQQAKSSESDPLQLENAIRTKLDTATSFPVRYEPPKSLLSTTSGRITLSIVRSSLEKNWDVKQINTQLTEDAEKTLCWLIRPKRMLEQPKIRKDDDDLGLEDLMSPLKGLRF